MGLIIAILIIGFWGGHLAFVLFSVEVAWSNPWMYMHLLIQAYLYTGLFITGHDAMHQSVSHTSWINKLIGYMSVFLFAGMSYKRLIKNHWEHHKYPGTENDPDFYMKSQNFFVWWTQIYSSFAKMDPAVAVGGDAKDRMAIDGLVDQDGSAVDVGATLAVSDATLLVFYRGHW